ncbi:hypothetical protein [uncultured Thiothrix sp.]|uniref:hypothetical protein n=1 Tax=uncultured Thiothrix sp. TaxID=223185 RepID=UPI00261452DB|nr:hypothetical protein [uncultured Thiothrix sp.]
MSNATAVPYGLTPQTMQACAKDLAVIAQKYNATLGKNLKLEMSNSSKPGYSEVNVTAITDDGKKHSLVRIVLKRDEPTKHDLGLTMGLYKS